ncbi:MAG: beta-propeller fold lactonase family protein [Chlorobia bacterium]|nr:beta-propeller fold lactonase family protein [Fimbriimonadaceae bacterium]
MNKLYSRLTLIALVSSGIAQALATPLASVVLGMQYGNKHGVGAVFAMTNNAEENEVIAFSRAADGTLRLNHTYSTRGNGQGVDFDTQGGLTLSRDRRFLYACNPGSDDVTVFAVFGSKLKFVQKVHAGDQPTSITLSGGLAYVLDSSVAGNGITGFTVAPNGMLTAIPNSFRALSSPIAVPGEVRFNPAGDTIVVTHKVGSMIDVFRLEAGGLLSNPIPNPSVGPRPFALYFQNNGRLFVVESGLPMLGNTGVSSYDLNTGTGMLAPITISAKNGQTDGCWIVIRNDQQFAYVANFINGTVSSYALGSNGTATLIDADAGFSGAMSQPTDLAFDADTRYLYNLLRGGEGIAGYRVETDGSLTALGIFGVGSGFHSGDGPSGLAAL